MLARIARKEFVYLDKRAVLLNKLHVLIPHESFATNAAATSSPRRLRRLKPTRSRWDNEFKMTDTGGLEQAFTPQEDNFGDYLKKVSLSPWVPTPDPVARRVFDLLNAGPDDVHVDLGSGDGRMNFHASDPPYGVKQSTGIDIDTKIVAEAHNRLSKRHPKPPIDFVIGDLKDPKAKVWNQVADASIITMYFVKEALEEIQPTLEKVLLGKKVRIATIGYAMPKTNVEWDPTQVEVILGTPIHIYELGYPMSDRLTPPDVDLPTAGDASDIKLHKGRQPFNDEYADIERGENPLVPPDDYMTEEDEDWDTIPGAPSEEEQDPRRQTWKKP